jgi:RNA polymerase sigma-70 factor (ECF subfamily)
MTHTLEDTFRRSRGALVTALTRAIGPARLDVVESVVQEAFLRAVEEWQGGAPHNPAGWLLTVARNLALDHLRRERTLLAKEEEIARFLELRAERADAPPGAALKGELADDQLAMIFVACHPCNSVPSQIALALRTLCGLDVPAIARALFSSEDAIEKRLVLARRRLREGNVSFDLPSPAEMGDRLEAVLRVLYLVFNEAYWGTAGPDMVQEDAAAEAIRLVTFLAQHPATRRPEVLALLSLMHFHASRFPARVDANGDPLLLAEQDRSKWSREHIDLGMRCLAASAEGDTASAYHYEAAIASLHATSPSHQATDWARVVLFYDRLLALNPSPSARLSRAIAVSFRDGPERGLSELSRLASDERVRDLAPFHAAEGDALLRLGDVERARAAFERARACAANEHARRCLDRRIAGLGG